MAHVDGKKLHELVRKTGLPMNEIASKMGLTPQNLAQRWKSQEPSYKFIKDLAAATNKSINYYLEAEQDSNVLAEPGAEYAVSGKPLPMYVIEVQKELIDVQRDCIKDKAEIVSLQKEKIKWLVNEHQKPAKKRTG